MNYSPDQAEDKMYQKRKVNLKFRRLINKREPQLNLMKLTALSIKKALDAIGILDFEVVENELVKIEKYYDDLWAKISQSVRKGDK